MPRSSIRDGAVMVCVSVPGQRWEIEFLEDGSVEAERFISTGDIGGEAFLHELLAQFGAPGVIAGKFTVSIPVSLL